MMKSRIICILLLLVGVSGIYAQSLTVTGKVVDNEGLEVIGGNVTVKGKQNTGTITDINGKYTITVSDPQKDVLVFSFIGLENMEVPVKGRKQIDVTMKAASVLLDEVVAIGYATVKRKDLTGSVASVRSDDLLKVPSSDVSGTYGRGTDYTDRRSARCYDVSACSWRYINYAKQRTALYYRRISNGRWHVQP